MSTYLVDSADLTAVANAIRAAGGTSAELAFPADFVSTIEAIAASSGLKYDMGTYTPASNTIANTSIAVPHNLGSAPDFVLVWTDFFEDEANLPASVASNFGYVFFRDLTSLPQQLTSSVSASAHRTFANFVVGNGASKLQVTAGTSTAYEVKLPTASVLYLHKMGGSNYWRGGATYHWFVAKKWW